MTTKLSRGKTTDPKSKDGRVAESNIRDGNPDFYF